MNNGDMPATGLTVPMSDVAKQQAAASGWPQEPTVHLGLTKREYFAGLAMQGYLAMPNVEHVFHGQPTSEQIAKQSVMDSDALLAALDES